MDASSDVAAHEDAGAPEDASVSCPAVLARVEHDVTSHEAFYRLNDFLSYFRSLATHDQLVVPAHGVDCSSSAPDGGTCTYDPRQQRLDASDIHYSNDVREFTGPDGQPWVWTYFPDKNLYLAASEPTDPNAYACIVQYNTRDD